MSSADGRLTLWMARLPWLPRFDQQREMARMQMGFFVYPGSASKENFRNKSSDLCLVQFPRVRDTSFTGVTVEECRVLLSGKDSQSHFYCLFSFLQ